MTRAFTFVAMFVLLSCAPLQNGPAPQQPTTLAVKHLATLVYSDGAYAAEAIAVVRDATTFDNLWAQMNRDITPAPPAPTVDFTKDMVLVAAAGPKPTGGYSITINGATQTANGITVNVTATTPGSSCAVTTAITSPVDMATIPQSAAGVTFIFTRTVQNC